MAYQDGTRAEIETEIVMVHKTRIDNLANIMLDGVGTSNASRTIVGLKCDSGQEVSHDGGRCAPLDFFIGCSIEVRALASAVRRSHRIGGNNVRVVVFEYTTMHVIHVMPAIAYTTAAQWASHHSTHATRDAT